MEGGLRVLIYGSDGKPISAANPLPVSLIPLWATSQDSVANTALTVTRAAEASRAHYVTMLEVVVSGAAAANDITVLLKQGATVKWKEVIGSGAARGTAVGFTTSQGIEFAENTAVTVEVLAGGAGVVTTTNLAGYTV